jgi:hypothetical protein
MSFIYEKLPASGEKCLILEPREALFYPFDFGTGWSEIRLGTVNSFTDLTENGTFTTDSCVTSVPGNGFYYGFVYSPNNELPFTKDVIAFVRADLTGVATTVALNTSTSNVRGSSAEKLFVSGTSVRGSVYQFAVSMMGGTAASSSGSGNFAGANVCRLIINQTSKTFSFNDNGGIGLVTYPSNNTSTSRLRSSMSAFSFTPIAITGYYTVDGTSGTDILPLPNKALIYSPFLNNRLRIHNLVVERYA